MTSRSGFLMCESVYWLSLFLQPIDPCTEFVLRGSAAESVAVQPGAAAGIVGEVLAALADAASAGCAERDHSDAVEVIGLHEGVHDPGLFSPPDGIADVYGLISIK